MQVLAQAYGELGFFFRSFGQVPNVKFKVLSIVSVEENKLWIAIKAAAVVTSRLLSTQGTLPIRVHKFKFMIMIIDPTK